MLKHPNLSTGIRFLMYQSSKSRYDSHSKGKGTKVTGDLSRCLDKTMTRFVVIAHRKRSTLCSQNLWNHDGNLKERPEKLSSLVRLSTFSDKMLWWPPQGLANSGLNVTDDSDHWPLSWQPDSEPEAPSLNQRLPADRNQELPVSPGTLLWRRPGHSAVALQVYQAFGWSDGPSPEQSLARWMAGYQAISPARLPVTVSTLAESPSLGDSESNRLWPEPFRVMSRTWANR